MNTETVVLLFILIVLVLNFLLTVVGSGLQSDKRIVDRLDHIITLQNETGTLIGEFMDVVKNLELDD